MTTKKLFIIACEPSGDTHAAHLLDEIKKIHPDLELRGLGGPKLKSAGVKLIYDMTTISALGFGDVIRQYFKYLKIFNSALEEVERFKPDALILVDSPAFNLRFAKKIKKRYPVLYYISPQIWAWGWRRIKVIRRTITKMLVALPFEEAMYREQDVPVDFVGHPLLDQIPPPEPKMKFREMLNIPDKKKAIGLIPGSREKEVRRILPLMLESADKIRKLIPEASFFLTRAPNIELGIYQELMARHPGLKVTLCEQNLHDVIRALDFALITSGTVTLEAALLGTPYFLLYKASWSTYFLGKHLIRVPFLGLVNLLAERKVIPEFIQSDIHPETIAHETKVLFGNPELYEKMKSDFEEVRARLGQEGAGRRAAESVLASISGLRPIQ